MDQTSEPVEFFQRPVWSRRQADPPSHPLQKGDHVWCHTQNLFYGFVVQHHGIWDGTGGVYHFDSQFTKRPGDIDSYYVNAKCTSCKARQRDRTQRGLGDRGVRLSCLACFSHGSNVYRCKYGATKGSRLWRLTGSRERRPCVRSGDEVVAVAEALYEGNNFGKYELLTHNCEDFARWCKLGKLGSLQASGAVVWMGMATLSVVRTSGILVFLKARRVTNARSLRRAEVPQCEAGDDNCEEAS